MRLFSRVASVVSRFTGHPSAFLLALSVVVVWAITGPLFGFSDTWQLVINTGTTIVTFLMVFLIQSTQNRDTAAVHIKLDELIRAVKGAQNTMIDIEALSEDELAQLRDRYAALGQKANEAAAKAQVASRYVTRERGRESLVEGREGQQAARSGPARAKKHNGSRNGSGK